MFKSEVNIESTTRGTVPSRINTTLRGLRALGNDAKTSILRYRVRQALLDARYGKHKVSGSLKTLGAVTGIQPHERGITVNTQNGALKLTVITPDCMQVRFQESRQFAIPFSYAVAKVS